MYSISVKTKRITDSWNQFVVIVTSLDEEEVFVRDAGNKTCAEVRFKILQTKWLQLQHEKNAGRRVQNYCELMVRKSELTSYMV
jgi:hypothetical protein